MLLQRLEKAFHIPQPGAWVFNVCASQAQALGSIEQFKVFGPPEEPCFSLGSAPKLKAASIMEELGKKTLDQDPFVIETDKVLGVGGQGTVYLCHKQCLELHEFGRAWQGL